MLSKIPLIARSDEERDDISRFPDWREVFAIILERVWVGVAMMVAVFLFTFVQVKRETPYFRSTAVLLVEAQMPRLMNFQDVMSFNMRNLEYFNTIIKTLHSRQIMELAVRKSGLIDHADFFPQARTLEEKAIAALQLVSITPVEKSRLIDVSVEYHDPQIASDLANAVAQAYIQADLDDRMKASMQAVDWLRERSVEYRERLEAGLNELQLYRESTQSVSLEEDQNIVIAKLKALNATLTVAQTQRIDAETRWQAIDAQLKQDVPMIDIAAQLSDAGVAESLSLLQAQERRVSELQQRYRPGYPDLQNALVLQAQLEERFRETCNRAVNSLKRNYEMLRDREANLLAALQEQEKEAFELDRKLVRYNDLKRNVEADEEIYQSVISRMKEANISGSLPGEIIRIAEEARPAAQPFRPQVLRSLIRGLFFGVAGGLLIIIILYNADHRFRRNEEVERALQVPMLSTLPLIEADSIHERGMIAHLNQGGEVAESFRTLRASLMINPATRASRVLMVTSAQAGEGKSLVASNLAISFAQDGKKTLLIGADLRRAALSKIFDVSEDPNGLSSYLKGETGWRKALLRHDVPNLAVLPSGKIPSHPSELLGTDRLGEFMKEAADAYDHIIIDAPPVIGVSDSLVLLSHAQGVLFVVRYAVTHSLGATQAMKKIMESGTPCLGAIMNGVNLNSFANYYYYRRYGGYAYKKYQSSYAAASTGV
jgi:capsular exopolysaccharide synthesis family protein